MKSRLTGIVTLAVSLVLLSSLALASQASAAPCGATGSTTLVHQSDLRIYRLGNSVWVCSTLYGRHIRLARFETKVDQWRRPSQRTFAYAIAGGGEIGIFGANDLKTGTLLHRHVTATFTQVSVDRLVARRDGSIAYIFSWIGSSTHDAGNKVQKADTTGFRGLDSDCVLCSNQIDTSFLKIVGNTVEWMDNSMVQSAPFH
jgi:hypothetical protein